MLDMGQIGVLVWCFAELVGALVMAEHRMTGFAAAAVEVVEDAVRNAVVVKEG